MAVEGGGGGWGEMGEVQKKYLRKGKLKEKSHLHQITLNNIHVKAFKRIHAKETFSKKIRAARKFPTLPILNFSNGASLSLVSSEGNTTESMVYSR